MKSNYLPTKARKGFSIVEVAVAMGVVTLMLTTFIGIFGPAQKNVQRAISTKDAIAMKDALSNELAILRGDQPDIHDSSYAKAIAYIEQSHDKSTAVLIYRYKAAPEDTGDGVGILLPYTGDGLPGRDYVVETAVRKIGDAEDDASITAELGSTAIDGPVFAVRMTELIKGTNGNLELSGSPETVTTDPLTGAVNGAVVTFRAEFFKLAVNKSGYVIGGNWNFDSIGTPVAEMNMAVRR